MCWISVNAKIRKARRRFQEARELARREIEANQALEDEDRSIKLGLGDFVFYSVLVSVAGSSGLLTLVSCLVVVLMGLGGTLVLLAVFHKALPALPISNFCGVIYFLLVHYLVVPYIDSIASEPIFV